jgi:hypothetical protein
MMKTYSRLMKNITAIKTNKIKAVILLAGVALAATGCVERRVIGTGMAAGSGSAAIG